MPVIGTLCGIKTGLLFWEDAQCVPGALAACAVFVQGFSLKKNAVRVNRNTFRGTNSRHFVRFLLTNRALNFIVGKIFEEF